MQDKGMLIHAPTAAALLRARNNVMNFRKSEPLVPLQLLVNGPAVAQYVLPGHEDLHEFVVLCENSLRAQGLQLPAGVASTASAIIYAHTMQQRGWSYWRA